MTTQSEKYYAAYKIGRYGSCPLTGEPTKEKIKLFAE